MRIEAFTISLRVFHPSASHGDIAATLGLEPEVGHTAGAPRSTSQGQALDGVYRESYCSFAIVQRTQGYFVEEVRELILRFEPYKDFFAGVQAEGGRSELFVGLFGDEAVAFTLDSGVLAGLSSLSLQLSVEAYGD